MEWGFVWIMLILKIPLFTMLYIVWYAIKDPPEPALADDGTGGADRPRKPRPITPRHPRRGPHGGAGDARIRLLPERAQRLPVRASSATSEPISDSERLA